MSKPDIQPGSDVPEYGSLQDQTYAASQPPPVPEEPARLGPVARLTGMIFSPGETFADINRKPTWVVPLLLSIVLAAGFSFFFKWRVPFDMEQIVRNQMRQATERRGQPMPPDDMIRQQAGFATIISNVAPYVAPPVVTFFLAGVFALGLMLMSAQTTFKKILSVVAWSGVTTTLVYYIVAVASLMVRDPATVDPTQPGTIAATNLGAFISTDTPPLRSLLSSIDVFTIWYLILLTIGFAIISGSRRITTGKTGTLVFGLWAVYVLIAMGMASLF